jgi:hypothetical protein
MKDPGLKATNVLAAHEVRIFAGDETALTKRRCIRCT